MHKKQKKLAEILSGSMMLGGVPESAIDQIAARGRTVSIRKDEMIFLEGEGGTKFYVLVDGLVKLFKTTDNDREVVVRYVRPGEMFAEVVLFETENYPVSSAAMRDSELFVIERGFFMELLKGEEFMRQFISNLFSKMRYLADRVAFLNAYDVEERFFIFLDEHFGIAPVIRVDLSKSEMAEAIGTIPETISRMIGRLKTAKLVTWDKNEIKLDYEYARSVVDKVRLT